MARKDETTSLKDAWFIDEEAPFVGKDATLEIRNIDMLPANGFDERLVAADGLHYTSVSLRGARVLPVPAPESYDETGSVDLASIEAGPHGEISLPESFVGRIHRKVEDTVAELLETFESASGDIPGKLASLTGSKHAAPIAAIGAVAFVGFVVMGGIAGASAATSDGAQQAATTASIASLQRDTETWASRFEPQPVEVAEEFSLEELDAMNARDAALVNVAGSHVERSAADDDQPRRRAVRRARHRRR